MMTVCPICRKSVCIHWPEHWVYRRGQTYYCSDQCMDVDITRTTKLLNEALRKKREGKIDMKQKITLEMKKKAVEMAIKGEDPLAYLKKCGSKNPSASWAYIKTTLEKKDPAMFAKLPERLPRKLETPEGEWTPAVKVYGPVKIETPEPENVDVVKTAGDCMADMQAAADKFFDQCIEAGLKLDSEHAEDDFEDCVIRSKKTGARYEVFQDSFCLKIGSDEFVLAVETWKNLLKEIPKAAHKLGVEL